MISEYKEKSMVKELARKNVIWILACFTFLFFYWPMSHLLAKETGGKGECFAIGTGTIAKGNLVRGKKSAIYDALLKGAEEYLVQLLGSQAVATHFECLSREIIPHVDQEIEIFHILAEQQVGNRYNVFVKIKINENSIAEKLREAGIFKAVVSRSVKILFMVSEKPGPVEGFWWRGGKTHSALTPIELALYAVFQDMGFNPTNRIMDLPASDLLPEQSSAVLSPEGAAQWGKLFSADVVIYGKSLILDNRLTLNLKALNVEDGTQICEKSGSEQMPPGTVDDEKILDLMRKCVNRLAVDLGPCILQNIRTETEAAHQLNVTLANISQPRQFQTFSDFIKTHIPGVKSIIPSKIGEDSMSATVNFQGDRVTFISLVLNNSSLPFPLHLGRTDTDNILFYLE